MGGIGILEYNLVFVELSLSGLEIEEPVAMSRLLKAPRKFQVGPAIRPITFSRIPGIGDATKCTGPYRIRTLDLDPILPKAHMPHGPGSLTTLGYPLKTSLHRPSFNVLPQRRTCSSFEHPSRDGTENNIPRYIQTSSSRWLPRKLQSAKRSLTGQMGQLLHPS